MRVWLVALLLVAMAGCSDDSDDSDDGSGDAMEPGMGGTGGDDGSMGNGTDGMDGNDTAPVVEVEVALTGAYPANIAYSPDRIEVAAGSMVKLTFTNSDQNVLVNHDWVLEGIDGAATDVIGNGASDEISFMAPPPGEYTFYCSVPGHRDNGMEGTFVVA